MLQREEDKMAARKTPGIRVRHSRNCASSVGRRCNCNPSYEASVFSRRDGKKVRKTFLNRDEAKAWRHDALVAVRKGGLRMRTPLTLSQAAHAWLQGVRDGSIRNRSGDLYKPSVIRTYDIALRLRVLPELGSYRLADLRRTDLQDFADRLLADGTDPSTIKNTLMPLRAIYRRHVARGDLAANPTTGLELPAVRGTRDRIVDAGQAEKLIAALRRDDRALWGTALYAGLRRGELMALRWSNVNLAEGVIRVERSWDLKEGEIEPKSARGKRNVPIPAVLRDLLVEQRMRVAKEGFAFGRRPDHPFEPTSALDRARTDWKQAELESITLHEARHTFASLMIAAGVNPKALSVFMGHASISITLDRYGHLMPGNEEEAAGLLDAYLARAATGDRSKRSGRRDDGGRVDHEQSTGDPEARVEPIASG
jgi:integrase